VKMPSTTKGVRKVVRLRVRRKGTGSWQSTCQLSLYACEGGGELASCGKKWIG
jgi:hypothetical protein